MSARSSARNNANSCAACEANRPSERHSLQKLELQPGLRVNHRCAGGMSILRLSRCLWRPAGWTLLVFTGILRPFTSIEASSTVRGPDLRGLAREDVIFPNALVPALNTTFPLTETSCAIFASKLRPTTLCEVTRLTVVSVSVVPAGIVAAFKDDATKHAQTVAIRLMNLYRIILI